MSSSSPRSEIVEVIPLLKQTLRIIWLLWLLTLGNCAPSIFPEKEPPSPVDPSWHAYKEHYRFSQRGVPKEMAEAFIHEGLHTVLARAEVPTDGIDRLDESLRMFAQKHQLEYRREGSTSSLVFSTGPMTGRSKPPGTKDIARGTNPKLYDPFIELVRILNKEPDLFVLIHGHGGDWFPDDHEVALELGFALADAIRKLMFRVGMKDMDRVDSFGCDQDTDGTVIITLVSPKAAAGYKSGHFGP